MGKALLIIVLGFSGIFTLVLFNATANQQRSSEALVTQYEKWIARNTVESVSNVALSKLYQDPTWNTGLSGTFNDATYNVTVTDVTIDSVHYAKKDSVTAIATFEGESDTTVFETIQPAYSHFEYFANNWPGSLTYQTGDTIRYPIHANNDEIEVSGSPVFLGKVTAEDQDGFNPSSATPVFHGGAEFGVAQISMPDITALSDTGQAIGYVESSNDLWLDFVGASVDSCSANYVSCPTTIPLAATNGIIMTTNARNIHLKGTVNGQVTVYSDGDLHIEDSITYSGDTDYLGLISNNHMEVHFPIATGTVSIYGALIVGNDFKVTSHRLLAVNLTLRLRGALIVKDDKAFTSQVSGLVLNLDRDFVYDPRMGGRTPRTPPYFPRVPSHIELVYRSN